MNSLYSLRGGVGARPWSTLGERRSSIAEMRRQEPLRVRRRRGGRGRRRQLGVRCGEKEGPRLIVQQSPFAQAASRS